jgi:hypothetical protein
MNRDGSPQVSSVWIGVEGDKFVSGHLHGGQQKLRNVRRDPRVTLAFEGTKIHPSGVPWGRH